MEIHSLANALGLFAISAIALAGCGGSGGNSDSASGTTSTGYFVDSPVSGLSYRRSDGFTGTTGPNGEFEYVSFDEIEFRVGDVSLGSVTAWPPLTILGEGPSALYLTPASLENAGSQKGDKYLVNRLIFLQTLDTDGNLDNGIQIPDEAHRIFQQRSIDFEVATDDFIKGDFRSIVRELDASGAFSGNRPRKVQTRLAALLHFGQLNLGQYLDLRTFTAWWQEQDGCTGFGKSRLAVANDLVEFCPNLNGLDSCYEGAIASNGDILLPKMKANRECRSPYDADEAPDSADCVGYRQFTLHADLKIKRNQVSGNFQASCQNTLSDQRQLRESSFIEYDDLGSARTALLDEISAHVDNGACLVDTDCQLLVLGGDDIDDDNVWLRAYAPLEVDETLLAFQKYQFDDMLNGPRYTYNPYPSGITISFDDPFTHPQPVLEPTARCVVNSCRIVQVPVD